jgi:hypothetical protein
MSKRVDHIEAERRKTEIDQAWAQRAAEYEERHKADEKPKAVDLVKPGVPGA